MLFSNLSARYRDYQSDNELDTLTFIVAISMWSFFGLKRNFAVFCTVYLYNYVLTQELELSIGEDLDPNNRLKPRNIFMPIPS